MSQQTATRPNGRPEFISLIAVYQFITGGILLLLSCLIPAVLFPAIFIYVGDSAGIFTGLFLATAALTLLLGFGFASIAVGWGLLRLREWARLSAIVLAAFALIGFPIWTIVAILILIYLTSEDAKSRFGASKSARAARDDRPDMAAQAVYKAEPPSAAAEETRRMTYTGTTQHTAPREPNGSPDETVAADETGAVPMPPDDPAWATEAFYDEEADVTDHYRRWKESLPQEPGTDEPATGDNGPATTASEETTEMPAESAQESAGSPEEPSAEEPLSSDEGDIPERIWGPDDTPDESEADERAAPDDGDADGPEPDERNRKP